jgi:hypothetical protein
MKALFGSCFFILFTSIFGLKGALIDSKVLVLNEKERPQLFYLGFQKYNLVKDPFSFGKSTLYDVWDADDFFSAADDSLQPPFIASFPCTILLNELYSETETGKAVAINTNHDPELQLAMALKDFEIRKAAKIKIGAEKKAKVTTAESISGKNTFYSAALPSSTPGTPDFRIGEVVSYLAIFSGFLLTLYGLQNNVLFSNQTVSKQRIIIARRKRWLQNLARYGLINQKTFTLLMKQIKAKDWDLRLKKTTCQSELLEPDDIIGDLSNRNNGESVVKIRDISLPKTSR